MDDSEAKSLEQIRAFLAGSGQVRFAGQRREEVYGWVEKTLVRHQYVSLNRTDKGLVRRYLARMTGLGRAQVTRLIAEYRRTGRVKAAVYQRKKFATRYTAADVVLLAYVDKAHQNLSGPATRRILEREYGEYGQALKALFDTHAEVDFDTDRQQSRLALKDMVEALTGMDLGNDDIASEEELFKRMQQGLAEDSAAAQAAEPPRRQRKSKAQQQREAETQLATQSVREVFRKLASVLHPDRETDAKARETKTALMQKANQAYANNDLLTLLELQLQVEQVDAGHIAQASTQRIRHYNKVLAEQLDELKAEIDNVEMGFRMDFGLEPGLGLNPKKLFGSLDAQARDMRAGLALRQQQLRKLDDRVGMKRWLKRQRQRLREPIFDDDFF